MDGLLPNRCPGRHYQRIKVSREVMRLMAATAARFGLPTLLATDIARSITAGGSGASGTSWSATRLEAKGSRQGAKTHYSN